MEREYKLIQKEENIKEIGKIICFMATEYTNTLLKFIKAIGRMGKSMVKEYTQFSMVKLLRLNRLLKGFGKMA